MSNPNPDRVPTKRINVDLLLTKLKQLGKNVDDGNFDKATITKIEAGGPVRIDIIKRLSTLSTLDPNELMVGADHANYIDRNELKIALTQDFDTLFPHIDLAHHERWIRRDARDNEGEWERQSQIDEKKTFCCKIVWDTDVAYATPCDPDTLKRILPNHSMKRVKKPDQTAPGLFDEPFETETISVEIGVVECQGVSLTPRVSEIIQKLRVLVSMASTQSSSLPTLTQYLKEHEPNEEIDALLIELNKEHKVGLYAAQIGTFSQAVRSNAVGFNDCYEPTETQHEFQIRYDTRPLLVIAPPNHSRIRLEYPTIVVMTDCDVPF